MNNRNENDNLRKLIVNIFCASILVVGLSSYIQIHLDITSILFFLSRKNSDFTIYSHLWIIGFGIDLVSLFIYTLPSLFTKKYSSPLVGIGWLFYFASCFINGHPYFFKLQASTAFVKSLLKILEFALLTIIHIFFVFLIPRFVENHISQRKS